MELRLRNEEHDTRAVLRKIVRTGNARKPNGIMKTDLGCRWKNQNKSGQAKLYQV